MGSKSFYGIPHRYNARRVDMLPRESQMDLACRLGKELHPLPEHHRHDRDLDRVYQGLVEKTPEQLATAKQPDVLFRLSLDAGDHRERYLGEDRYAGVHVLQCAREHEGLRAWEQRRAT